MRASLILALAIEKLAKQMPVGRIAYCGDYSYWLTTQAVAKNLGVGALRVSHLYNRDVDQRTIVLEPGSAHSHLYTQLDQWNRLRRLAISPYAIEEIAAGALYRLSGQGGTSTYSPNWSHATDPLQQLGLSRSRRTIVAYSSSSDEYVASIGMMKVLGMPFAEGPFPFPDQVTWLRSLSDFIAGRQDCQLIIRLHPRIAANHRHSQVASELAILREAFEHCPGNVAVVWPDQPVSSYNLAEIADVVTVAWSTIGLEAARFGIPVVSAFTGIGSFPTGSFIAYETSRDGYFSELDKALKQPATQSAITEAFRWTYHGFFASGVDVSDVVPTRDYSELPPPKLPREHDAIVRAILGGESLTGINEADLPTGAVAERLEREAIDAAIERFVCYFALGNGAANVVTATPGARPGWVWINCDGRRTERYSPLIRRLCELQSYSEAPPTGERPEPSHATTE